MVFFSLKVSPWREGPLWNTVKKFQAIKVSKQHINKVFNAVGDTFYEKQTITLTINDVRPRLDHFYDNLSFVLLTTSNLG